MKKYGNDVQSKPRSFISAHAWGFIIGILILVLVFVLAETYMDYKDKVVRYYFADGSYTDVVDGYYADATYPPVTDVQTTAPGTSPITPNK